ncbi:alpha/beta hydrolase [Rhodococcus sp. HNM0563]|uniref:alpha/beta fold hydrolase n=1 Tax=unclassified Rhodococcus (in: high G+C Gram-positive bacteria) TaxID=192944 RepID=UPI00146D38D4|nr:alpha/beta hydrolase [Rhodococcus sp. F64268]MCK0089628.1 alpha/beta hydrolase [Rhodococcus sp. F64268]NLU62435.1 alpha/beta hydrolase [Rhodococcus sp. HNM0563]
MTESRTRYPYRSPGDHAAVQAACRRALTDSGLPCEVQLVDTAQGATGVLVAGQPSALPPVVLVPGAEAPAVTMTAAIEAIGRSRQVFVPDPPGMPGLSAPKQPERDFWASYGSWLDTVLPALTPDPVMLVGHGLGAGIALAASREHQVTQLVLIGPLGLSPVRPSVAVRWRRWLWRVNADHQATGRLLQSLTAAGFRPDPAALAVLCVIGAHYRPPHIPHRFPEESVRRWTHRTPLTAVVGEYDPVLTGPALRALAARLPTASVRMLDGVGHLLPLEAPDRFAELLDRVTTARSAPRNDHP